MQTGLSHAGTFNIWKRHEETGVEALQDSPKGCKLGHGWHLEAAQEAAARSSSSARRQLLKIGDALRTRVAVGELIE